MRIATLCLVWSTLMLSSCTSERVVPERGQAAESSGRRTLEEWQDKRRCWRELAIAKHPEWSAEIAAAVRSGELLIAMDEEQVVGSWGPPGSVRKAMTPKGELSIFTYNNWQPVLNEWSSSTVRSAYLLDGRVTGWSGVADFQLASR